MIKILNVKSVMLLEYQNIKSLLQKPVFQVGLKKVLWLKNTLQWTCVISHPKGEKTCWKILGKKNWKSKSKIL